MRCISLRQIQEPLGPFLLLQKHTDEPYVNHATKVMLKAAKLEDLPHEPKLEGYAVKIPVFSYEKFPNSEQLSGARDEIYWRGNGRWPDIWKTHSFEKCTANVTCT